MPSNNSKYAPEFREQTARHIIETGKSATSVSEELGIDTNTVCRWVRDFRKKYDLPRWNEERKRRQKSEMARSDVELLWENKTLMKEVKKREKRIADLEEEKAILKKSLLPSSRNPGLGIPLNHPGISGEFYFTCLEPFRASSPVV
jgi:transposase